MNGDGDTRGQELSESEGHPGQAGNQHFGPVSGDGVTAPVAPPGPSPSGNSADGGRPNGPAGDQGGGWGQATAGPGMTSAADGSGTPAGDGQGQAGGSESDGA